MFKFETEIIFSDSYIEKGGNIDDFREIIHPSSKPTERVKINIAKYFDQIYL